MKTVLTRLSRAATILVGVVVLTAPAPARIRTVVSSRMGDGIWIETAGRHYWTRIQYYEACAVSPNGRYIAILTRDALATYQSSDVSEGAHIALVQVPRHGPLRIAVDDDANVHMSPGYKSRRIYEELLRHMDVTTAPRHQRR